jgi:hypothetical protein
VILSTDILAATRLYTEMAKVKDEVLACSRFPMEH